MGRGGLVVQMCLKVFHLLLGAVALTKHLYTLDTSPVVASSWLSTLSSWKIHKFRMEDGSSAKGCLYI